MNILENDTTEFIEQSIKETLEQINQLNDEVESCQDYIDEARDELRRRKTAFKASDAC